MNTRSVMAFGVALGMAVLLAGFPVRGTADTPPAAAAPATPAAAPDPPPTPEEKADAEIGKKAADEIEKQLKVLDKYPGLPRIEQVVDRLRPATEKPRQKYTLKVVDSKAINAFSLPGGYIYFTKGLMDAVESDDELAAVAGHEMGHICLDHSRKLMAQDEKYSKILGPVVLAAILGRKSGVNPGAVATVGSLVMTDSLNHYSRAAELEADQASLRYLSTSKAYNPVAVLTVVEGLARIDEATPGPEPGVFQTHPYAKDRVVAVRKQLEDMRVPIERGRVRKGLTAVAGIVRQDGKDIGELRLDDQLVFQPAAEVDGLSAIARAQHAADVLNPMLLKEIDLVDIAFITRGETAVLQARGETLFRITPADAAFHKTTVDGLAKQAMHAIQLAFYADRTKRAY